jgi:Lysyl oxidase
MRRRLVILLSVVAMLVGSMVAATGILAGKPQPAPAGLLPDLRAVVPQHVQLVSQQQREWLRFSNGIGNTGAGPWALRPEPPPASAVDVVSAVQEIRDSGALYRCGTQPRQVRECHNVVSESVTGTFVFHPTHNHWHLGAVALFEVRKGSPTGPLVGNLQNKTSFCLIDLYKLDGNAPTSEKVFWDCYTSYQGVSAGWVDQYHQATDGQELDITGIPNATDYYLVTTTNPDGIYLESNTGNNKAWVKFTLSAESNGQRKIAITDHSPCDSPGMCGEVSANR